MNESSQRWFPTDSPSQQEEFSHSSDQISHLSPRQKKKRFQRQLAGVGIVVLVVGFIAAMIAVQTNLDLRQFAWGGVTLNQAGLQGRQMSLEEIAKLQKEKSEASALFTQLTQTYFDADVANIDNPDFQIKGVVFKKYDPSLNQTLVYARLSNMPLLAAVPAMWLEKGVGEFLPAGVGEVVLENNVPVGYFMTTLEGDATGYETLNFSYDASVSQKSPSSIYMSVEFDKPQEQT